MHALPAINGIGCMHSLPSMALDACTPCHPWHWMHALPAIHGIGCMHSLPSMALDACAPCHQWQRDGVYLARTAFWYRRSRPRAAAFFSSSFRSSATSGIVTSLARPQVFSDISR